MRNFINAQSVRRFTTMMCVGLITTTAAGQLQATEATKLVTTDADTNDRAGTSLALSGTNLAVGARWDSELGTKAGAAYIYNYSDGLWQQEAKLLGSDTFTADEFGFHVAINNEVAVVGARFDDDDGSKSGSAYVFRRRTTWGEEAKLTASDASASSDFGTTVAISGSVIAVAAPNDDEAHVNAGAVYMFRFDGSTWNEEAKIVSPTGGVSDNFGEAMALGRNILLVGCPNGDDGASNAGIVFVFEYDGFGWNQTAMLKADDRASNDNFGSAVALSSGVALIGAPGNDDGGSSTGSAYMFVDNGDGTWSQTDKLSAANPEPFDGFGEEVALWGPTAIVSSPFDDDGGTNSGAAYVFYHDGTGWQQQVKLLASDAAATDGLGTSVAIGKQGGMLGAPFDDDGGASSGAAYFFGGLEDCDGNGQTDLADMVAGAANDNDGNGAPDECCPGDVDGDGRVFLTDLAIFLAMYGTQTADPLPSDMDGNGVVGFEDLQIILVNFGAACS